MQYYVKLELCRAGTTNSGQVMTSQELQDMVATFNENVPITISHELSQKEYFPALGNVKKVEIVGDTLVGECIFSDILYDAYKSGHYPAWSVGTALNSQNKRYLHHLAFLGAVPADFSGLKVLEEKAIQDGENPFNSQDTAQTTQNNQVNNPNSSDKTVKLEQELNDLKKEFSSVKVNALKEQAKKHLNKSSLLELENLVYAMLNGFGGNVKNFSNINAVDTLIRIFSSIEDRNQSLKSRQDFSGATSLNQKKKYKYIDLSTKF